MHTARTSLVAAFVVAFLGLATTGCEVSSDTTQREQQEKIMQEASAQTGMPAIKNFRERRLVKEILELRDQENLTTYTYLVNEMQGKLIFFCRSIGYGVPYATQYTNPERVYSGSVTLPQADPNSLFSPSSAEGTWVLCKNPRGPEVKPLYVEPRIVVSPFPLDDVIAVQPSGLAPVGARTAGDATTR